MNKPIIGINPYYYNYQDSWWMATKEDYINAVWRAGGIPMTVHYPDSGNTIAEILERIDGLLMVGGPDFHSSMYGGSQPELLSKIIHQKRESFDRIIFQEARRNNKPILAVCAGFQHINLIYGGSLYEDIPRQLNNHMNHGEFNGAQILHPVKLDDRSILYSIMGEPEPQVCSTHHQGIKILGDNLTAVAWTADGLIEAIEDTRDPRAFVAVQWHPELYQEDQANRQIFQWLVEEAVARSTMYG